MTSISASIIALALAPGVARPASTALAQDKPSARPTDDPLDTITQKSAAARLLAAMGPSTSIDTKVARLIDRLAKGDHVEVQAAVTALVILGRPAVPAIVRRIDDRRDIKAQSVAFENRFPDAFEAVAQYGVAKVVDCLDHVLSYVTGVSFGFIDDKSMDFDLKDAEAQRRANATRDAMVAGWRGYVAGRRPTPRAPGKSLPGAVPATRPDAR